MEITTCVWRQATHNNILVRHYTGASWDDTNTDLRMVQCIQLDGISSNTGEWSKVSRHRLGGGQVSCQLSERSKVGTQYQLCIYKCVLAVSGWPSHVIIHDCTDANWYNTKEPTWDMCQCISIHLYSASSISTTVDNCSHTQRSRWLQGELMIVNEVTVEAPVEISVQLQGDLFALNDVERSTLSRLVWFTRMCVSI